MPWTWVRPADSSVLAGRPLLDVGTGDGQTLEALAGGDGVVVGVDRSPQVLRAARHVVRTHLAAAVADHLPIRDKSFAVVLAADLFHHLDDARLQAVLGEFARVLRRDGTVVAWWYAQPGRGGPGDPRHPRQLETVAALDRRWRIDPLDLDVVAGTPQTVGAVFYRITSS